MADVQAGRTAVEQYRIAHAALYAGKRDNTIPARHTPLINQMKNALQQADFETIDEFFKASRKENVKTLGFASVKELFEKGTAEQKAQYMEMWR